MKKFLKAAGALALALAMTACGSGTATTTAATTAAQQTTGKGKIAYIVGNLGDKSFSDSGEKGMQTLRDEGWDVKTIETGDSSSADKYNDYIMDAIDNGAQYIVASSTYEDNMKQLCTQYPDVHFLCFDTSSDDVPANMSYILYKQNEGSYLVGYMAAAMTTTKVVAVNVGMENPVIDDFVTGFIEGVKAYDSSVSVISAEVGSWSDPATMKQICIDQANNNNADVFYQVAGGSGDGLFEAAMEKGAWAIGVDSDQYDSYKNSENPEKADVILTSMLKEVGNSFVSFFHALEKGEDVWGKVQNLGLAENSVGYVDNEFFQANVPAEVRDAMASMSQKAQSGELTIKSYYDFASQQEYQDYLNAAK